MKTGKIFFILIVSITFTLFSSCKEQEEINDIHVVYVDVPGSLDTPYTYFHTITELYIDIAYQQSVTPYTDYFLLGAKKSWDILEWNIRQLYVNSSRKPTIISSDIELDDMVIIPPQYKTTNLAQDGKQTYDVDEIMALADQHKMYSTTETKGHLFIMFLDGYFRDNTKQPPNDIKTETLGVQLGNTGNIAIFKNIISNYTTTLLNKKLMEQAVVVHEVGHAFGLVDLGVSMHSDHSHATSDGHCGVDTCVMSATNNGATDAKDFAEQIQNTGNYTLFGGSCIEDISFFVP